MRNYTSDRFGGFKIRVVDENGDVVFAPPVSERGGDFSVTDIADMLGVPVIDKIQNQQDPQEFLGLDDDCDGDS